MSIVWPSHDGCRKSARYIVLVIRNSFIARKHLLAFDNE